MGACTSGHILCNATVFGGRTRLIASHIHLASDDDGANGEGHPVFNFCGDGSRGLINDGAKYSGQCPAYRSNVATMLDMESSLVPGGPNVGITAMDRVRDILARPERYYFNFHSVASWAFWKPRKEHHGMCRGELALKRPRRTTTTTVSTVTTTTSTITSDTVQCATLYSDVAFNALRQ